MNATLTASSSWLVTASPSPELANWMACVPMCEPLRKTSNLRSAGAARARPAMPTASRLLPTSVRASLRPIREVGPSGGHRTARYMVIVSSLLLGRLAGRQLHEAGRHRLGSRMFLDPVDPCSRRPAMTPVDHLPDSRRIAGEQRFDGAIRPVAHPTPQPVSGGFTDDPATKPDTLHFTMDSD